MYIDNRKTEFPRKTSQWKTPEERRTKDYNLLEIAKNAPDSMSGIYHYGDSSYQTSSVSSNISGLAIPVIERIK